MPVRLDKSSADFDKRFAAFLGAKREASADVERATRAIVDDVAARCGSTSNAWNANWPTSAPTTSAPATSTKAPSRQDWMPSLRSSPRTR